MLSRTLFLAFAAWGFTCVAGASEPLLFPHSDRIRYDSQCLTIDGKDSMIFSGAFHYFRCPKELWRERFQKIKDAGFNCVETYAAWNWHEQEMPAETNDFSKVTDLQDLDDWLAMAEEFGLYVIIRPGPYICAEWDNGGLPQWLELKKPAKPLRDKVWLRTDDPVFMAWSKHWYDAVCPIIAKHQITRKAPGQPGVILFQIENEYDFWNLDSKAKINYLQNLATWARADGIDVPLFTSETSVERNQPSGPLHSVFDCLNTYPGWNIEKEYGSAIKTLRKDQPDAPLATTELQGGWFANVGGKLSEEHEGMTPAEIQNITLFAWQNGMTLTNYYMLFGGTNFDDWGSRTLLTSYDYNAPIREHGGVGERYQRVWALGHMLEEHGPKLVRSHAADIDTTATDNDVKIAERVAQDGSRYIFVRTENHSLSRTGTAHVKEKGVNSTEWVFDYQLEPFGSRLLYLAPGVSDARQGKWLPEAAPAIIRPTDDLPPSVAITQAQIFKDPLPTRWISLAPGELVEAHGALDTHFLYYRVAGVPGATVTLESYSGDDILAVAAGHLLPDSGKENGKHKFTLPKGADELVALYENHGHPNFGPELGMLNGIRSVQGASDHDPLQFSLGDFHGTECQRGEAFSDPRTTLDPSQWNTFAVAEDAASAPDALLTWYRFNFEVPAVKSTLWVPWHLHLEAKGNGFIYINGHALGRYWQAGPQHDFFLPSCWLNFGSGKANVVALDLRPVDKGVSLQSVSVAPDVAFAEKR